MRKLVVALLMLAVAATALAQDKKAPVKTETAKGNLAGIRDYVHIAQQNVTLYLQNLKDHSKENDVLYIINTAEAYMDSTQKSKETTDVLLRKHFMSMRNFFLTVSNKTSVAVSFLYTDDPYHFCMYNDTAVALYIAAMKNGNTYSAKVMTEKQVASAAFTDCVLPAMKALSEFKESEPKYFGLSVYYGCKDNKETAPNPPAIRGYCLTFVAPFADIRKYINGYSTAEELVEASEVYLSSDETPDDFRRIKITLE